MLWAPLALLLYSGGEAVVEEEHLEFDGVAPVWPVVLSGTRIKIMWDAFFQQLLVKVTVYLIEEVFGAAVNYDFERIWSDQVSQVDDSVVLPVLRVFTVTSQTCCYIPFFSERSDVYSA